MRRRNSGRRNRRTRFPKRLPGEDSTASVASFSLKGEGAGCSVPERGPLPRVCSLCLISSRMRCISPVSYTHLDVYKRQGTNYSVWKDRINVVAALYDGRFLSVGIYFRVCLK